MIFDISSAARRREAQRDVRHAAAHVEHLREMEREGLDVGHALCQAQQLLECARRLARGLLDAEHVERAVRRGESIIRPIVLPRLVMRPRTPRRVGRPRRRVGRAAAGRAPPAGGDDDGDPAHHPAIWPPAAA